MIRQNEGTFEIDGTANVLLAEFSCIVNGLYEVFSEDSSKEKAKEKLTTAFERGFMTTEETEEHKEGVCTGKLDELIELLEGLKEARKEK